MRTVIGSTLRLTARLIAVTVFALLIITPLITSANARQGYAGIVMDAKTGKILYSSSGNSKRYPASLTKMMTLYMLFEAMEKGEVSKKTRIRFSSHAASMQPSKLGIKKGSSISAEQAILALVTKSANDAAAAVGEHLGRTESNFAVMMTKKAHALGMKNTVFKNASGLPDSRQVTTAKDMAILGIALREHFPKQYKYFSTRLFKFGKKRYGNHNKLLGRVRGVDGIKTGYTRAAGFNLVTSVAHNRRSIVVVVMGGKTGKSRNAQVAKLIKKYLPRASRGRDRMIVAKGPKTSVFASLFKKKKKAPIPSARPQIQPSQTLVTASAASVPTPSPIAQVDKVVTSTITPSEPVSSQSEIFGWQVQIGAMPNKDNALKQLNSARKKLPAKLGSTTNYTETITKNGTLLYRARFAGFSSKASARSACSSLKKAKIDCLAILKE